MLNLVFQMGKSEMERKGNFAPSYLSFPVPFRPFQINPAFLSLSEKNGQLSGKGNIAFLSLTCMEGANPPKGYPGCPLPAHVSRTLHQLGKLERGQM